ncbi:helix-turn-helix transcriptional regulator [Hoeflea prorocentri]|uniref:LuxR C-terminal-related transcriptional regulator n=1 Tax=Hoeflea prorocentri TaxID=1922333 RepID=A0A9X3ZJE1_9HYPH|nr:LuxR C-terminal-related transcriptional regulator [Hoeflea prorocentri]MCY6382861.1 LuxR C-terminal-related transcriptional regulator [Hoeflea prorocentri]MDA5400661.1 LuxR C-terminal-related transcriptional regulator [Hoeflea prorocentri]
MPEKDDIRDVRGIKHFGLYAAIHPQTRVRFVLAARAVLDINIRMNDVNLSPEELSELIGLAYDSAFEPRPWQSLLDRLTALFPGIGANVYGYDENGPLPEYSYSGGREFYRDPTQVDLMELGLNVPDYLNLATPASMAVAEGIRHMQNGFVARTKVFFDEAMWVQTPIYKELLEPGGFKHTLQMKIEHLGDKGVMIGFALPADPEREAEIHDPLFNLLKLLSPHVLRATKLARAIALSKRTNEVFAGFIDGIVLPLLITDGAGKYLFGNAAGRRMIDRNAPFKVGASGILTLSDPMDTRALHNKLKQLEAHQAPGGMRLESEPDPLSLIITPFRPALREASAIDRHLLAEERLYAIVVGQTSNDTISSALLEDVLDLTAREAQVCKELLMGRKVPEIAESSGRSPKTIRNQIQTIYDKTGVASNTSLLDALLVFRTIGTLFDGEDADRVKAAQRTQK